MNTEIMKKNTWQCEDRRPIYIFCEGTRTEPLYFEGFKRHIEAGHPVYTDMIKILPCGRSGGSLLKQARNFVRARKISEGRIRLVYDKDDFPDADFDQTARRIEELDAEATRDSEGEYCGISWRAAWSNQCFEYWLMLHFAHYTSDSSRADYIRFLNREFETRGLGRYEKNRSDIFEVLMSYGEPKKALRYAERIERETRGKRPSETAPATRVHHLVRELAQYFPQEEKVRFMD